MDLQEKIKEMPDSAGVYLMKDKDGKIIYVGKAISLRKRLCSYIGKGLSSRTANLMSSVADIEYRLCATESLALLLEQALVRQYKPKYNVSLRDDKSFPSLRITNEEFPAIYITRKIIHDGSRYFGPYTSAGLLKEALKIIRKNFPYRSCRVMPKKACIYYRIKLSPAPCIGKISKEDYRRTIENIIMVLEGHTDELIASLTAQMDQKAKGLEFEDAGAIRDKILAIGSLKAESFSPHTALEELKEILKLNILPRRIEAFDVSNLFGKQAAASMVSFYDSIPDKNNYRRYRIKTVEKIDDYCMLAEVIKRRYSRQNQEKKILPDLILIDGGRGQVSASDNQLKELGLNIPVIGLAKQQEEIWALIPLGQNSTPPAAEWMNGGWGRRPTRGEQKGPAGNARGAPERKGPICLKKDSQALRLLMRLRDESHRFALKYHRLLRGKKLFG